MKTFSTVDANVMRIKLVKYPEVEEKLARWCESHEKITVISDAIIKYQAKVIAAELSI
ncbi:hypothetical protein ENBRE01_3253 [Enteropsectra breve]|nr:hypothetical protein ENBRE01_3253 [Enteropsectra breve]